MDVLDRTVNHYSGSIRILLMPIKICYWMPNTNSATTHTIAIRSNRRVKFSNRDSFECQYHFVQPEVMSSMSLRLWNLWHVKVSCCCRTINVMSERGLFERKM